LTPNKRWKRGTTRLGLETLEDRTVPTTTAAVQHVLLLSVDGLHGADVTDPALQSALQNIASLQQNGVNYTNAHTTSPSDSFPGTLSYLTGAGPGTTGVFYDDSYSRTLRAPGTDSSAPLGTEVTYFEAIDKNFALISGGGNFDASSINPSLLPIDPVTNLPVYPNQFLQTNTIFDVAHDAGLYTAFSDKHPAYQIANGTNPAAINDFYGPEINSTTALLDNATGQTVDANALLNDHAQPATGLSIAPGYTASIFASPPPGATGPDSIAVDGLNVYVGYNNGTPKTGASGSSTIALFTPTGPGGTWTVAKTFSVPGHTDGLKVDPATHKVWTLQNEDANPTLAIIDFTPASPAGNVFSLPSSNHGGGYDDITFTGGNVYFTASNPANNPNTDPVVVQFTVSGTGPVLTPILNGSASLNLQDPDSMTATPNGSLLFTSQSDSQLITVAKPGAANQSVTVVNTHDKTNAPVSVDDTLFNPGAVGEILLTDQTAGNIYQITVPAGSSAQTFSAAVDIGQFGKMDLKTGLFTPVITGFAKGGPRGLAFLNAGAFTDLSQFTLVDPKTDPVGPFDPTTGLSQDPNLINDTTTNVLLTEKYDDLKVAAILKEIHGQKSHNFFSTVAPQVPAIFGMNFQAVSVAEKDALGGITLLPNGQVGPPSALLEGALQHTDQSVGAIVAALKAQGLWNSTELYLTAKHGQDPRVGLAGLMHDDTLPNLLNNAGDTVAQATQDNVSLIWLANQAKTLDAVKQLEDLRDNGTLQVFFQGVPQTLAANQVIDKILWGKSLVDGGFGNPATDSTTPDIIVTLKPGYIWVGNVNSQHKRAEHGGFSDDSTHIALIVSGGALSSDLRGTTQTDPVDTKQIAVSVLKALGLDPHKLTGAVKEGTTALPGLGLPLDPEAVEDRKLSNALVATFTDLKATSAAGFTVTITWGDGTKATSTDVRVVKTGKHTFAVYAGHTFEEEGRYTGTVRIAGSHRFKATRSFLSSVAEEPGKDDKD
jgi:hypothetical protein